MGVVGFLGGIFVGERWMGVDGVWLRARFLKNMLPWNWCI
jgi:hypothetical protein